MMTTEQIKTVAPKPASVWQHHHILDVDDFSHEEIELVFNTTTAMKEVLSRPIKRVPALRGKTLITLFYEPSTRTRLSFELAAKNLGADAASLSATASSVFTVSIRDSPLVTLLAVALKLAASAPRFLAASSKESRVRVLGS